jgi:hypothetical protein
MLRACSLSAWHTLQVLTMIKREPELAFRHQGQGEGLGATLKVS